MVKQEPSVKFGPKKLLVNYFVNYRNYLKSLSIIKKYHRKSISHEVKLGLIFLTWKTASNKFLCSTKWCLVAPGHPPNQTIEPNFKFLTKKKKQNSSNSFQQWTLSPKNQNTWTHILAISNHVFLTPILSRGMSISLFISKSLGRILNKWSFLSYVIEKSSSKIFKISFLKNGK